MAGNALIGEIMKRNTMLKILNPILPVLVVNQAVTALFSTKMPFETFEFFHKGGGAILICLAIVHLILNFNWVKATYFPK
jgi:alanine-alpha-ketoisovalerate/valine-pyruvate aminotransferase